jgi:ABC-type Mn2+/Zn2+ transport system permease subunit
VRSAAQAVVAGAAVGALAGIAGIYASFKLDVAAGAAIALALCAAAAIGSALPAGGHKPRRARAV